MAVMTIQAPPRNLVTATMTSTTPVATAPIPLMMALRRQPGSFVRSHRRTMPDCDNVNAVNTPTT
jgi:hypothetical protein